MTSPKPTTAVPVVSGQQIPPPPSEDPLAVRVAEILLAGYALAKTAQLIQALLGAATGLSAVEAALGLAKTAHKARARLKVNGIEPGSAAHQLVKRTRNADVYFRAAYVVNAARRIQTRLDTGAPLREAIGSEKPNYDAHVRARKRRLDVAAQTATMSLLWGPLLGWYRNPLLDSDFDCRLADGHNFYADEGTVIGLPGAVHPQCGCHAGPPHENAALVNEVVASLTRAPAPRVPRRVPRAA